MLSLLFNFFNAIDSFFWSNIAFVLIMALGIYLTFRMRFFQILAIPSFCKIFFGFAKSLSGRDPTTGIHPIKAFFTSMGGMIGIGNIVGIVTALQIGGPGALFWVWIAALLGSIIKYAEIFLGLKHRVPNDRGGYDGGPVYFLKAAFKNLWIPGTVSALLCIYGVEVYQFTILTDCISTNWNIHKLLVTCVLLALVVFAGLGGIKRIAKICSLVIPFFVISYILMNFWIISQEIHQIPSILISVFKSAFYGHAAIGGFAGSSILLAIQHGTARAAYSADLGIGYDSIIQSESSTAHPEKQASLAILGVFIDNFICTLSILLVLITGLWKASPPLPISELVQTSLAQYFPYMPFFVPIFLLITGFTTVIAYLCVGLKCARFLAPKNGEKLYILYACFSFLFFSFFNPSSALLVMSISGALLLILNLLGIIRLRKQIVFPQVKARKKNPQITVEEM